MNQTRKEALDATAAERTVSLNIPVVAEVTAAPALANEFHARSQNLKDTHGVARAEFIQTLERASILQDSNSTRVFLKALDEYESVTCDGSGSGRWPDGTDNWTQTGDGTDYPGSYGVGPKSDIKEGDSVRVIGIGGAVDRDIHKVVGVGSDSIAVDDGNSYPLDKVVRVIPEMEAILG